VKKVVIHGCRKNTYIEKKVFSRHCNGKMDLCMSNYLIARLWICMGLDCELEWMHSCMDWNLNFLSYNWGGKF